MPFLSYKCLNSRPMVRVFVILLSIFTLMYPNLALAGDVSASLHIAYDTHAYDGEMFEAEGVRGDGESKLRRLKASSKVDFNDAISMKASLEYEVDDRKFVVDDFYLSGPFWAGMEFKLGQFKEPFGLENLQSLKFQYLRERSVATNAFTFSRERGFGLSKEAGRWYWEGAISSIEDSGTAYTTRLAFAPLLKKKRFIHLGAGWSTRDGIKGKYDIDETVIAHSVGNLIHSANYKPEFVNAGNIEFAARYRAFVIQSEAFWQDIQLEGNSYQLGGYYTSVLWTLMGRSREYKNGELDFDKPKKQTLELAARFSMADLESRRDGQITEVLSVALNYYFRDALRLTLEYERARLDSFYPRQWDTRTKGDSVSARLQLIL